MTLLHPNENMDKPRYREVHVENIEEAQWKENPTYNPHYFSIAAQSYFAELFKKIYLAHFFSWCIK